MIYVWHHAVVLLLAALAAGLLRRRWTWRCPRTAVLLWQATGLAAVGAAIGLLLAVGLLPLRRGILPVLLGLTRPGAAADLASQLAVGNRLCLAAGLLAVAGLAATLGSTGAAAVRARARHRLVLGLVGRRDDRAPGALVLDHPAAAAYCLPGHRPRVVLSAGALDRLAGPEIRAVLAHERAHVQERHHLVMLPFTALRPLLPVRAALESVQLLVEMCADDRAARQCGRRAVASALRQFAPAHTPAGGFSAADVAVAARVERLLGPARPLPTVLRWLLVAAWLPVAATPVSLLILPW